MKSIGFLRTLLVVGLVIGAAVLVNPVQIASAHTPDSVLDPTPEDTRIHKDLQARQHTGGDKALLYNVSSNDTVAVFVVEGSDTPVYSDAGIPNGTFLGATRGPGDGKPMELFLPASSVAEGSTAKISNIFLWEDASGWKLIDSIVPMPDSSDSVLSR